MLCGPRQMRACSLPSRQLGAPCSCVRSKARQQHGVICWQPTPAAAVPVCMRPCPVVRAPPSAAQYASQSASALSGSSDSDKFFMPGVKPSPTAGPVEAIPSQGRGYGLGLTRPCERGELLMVSAPISMVYGSETESEDVDRPGVVGGVGLEGAGEEEGEGEMDIDEEYDLRFEVLQDVMTKQRYTLTQASWLQFLAASSEDNSSAASRAPPPLCTDHAQPDEQRTEPLPEPLASDMEQLETLLQTHTFEADGEDEDLALLTGQEPRQRLLGLWPEHALLNHSCTPSTISYVHRGAQITRATRRGMAKGAELFTNYLGDLVMAPVDVRREALEDVWGFVCNCPRCKEEAGLDKDLQQLVKDVYEACTDQINDDLAVAIEEGDKQTLESLQEQLAAYVELIQAAIAKKRLSERTSVWLQASLFCVYESLHHVLEEQGKRDLGLTDKLQTLAGAIQPGSELHCFWARSHLKAVQEAITSGQLSSSSQTTDSSSSSGGPGRGGGRGQGGRGRGGRGFGGRGGRGSQGSQQQGITLESADEACMRALSARYGPISRTLYNQILTLQQELDEQDGEEELQA